MVSLWRCRCNGIEQLADKRYPTANDIDASLTIMAERKGWIAGFEAGMQSIMDNLLDLKWEDEYTWHLATALDTKYSINANDGKFTYTQIEYL